MAPRPEQGVESRNEDSLENPLSPGESTLDSEQQAVDRVAREEKERTSRLQEEHLGAATEGGFLLVLNTRLKDSREREETRKKLEEISNIKSLRNGGMTLGENDANYMEKFSRLASAYLTPVSETKNAFGHVEFLVDFAGNELAEWNVGAGHCLPPSVKKIRVYDEQGNEIFRLAERGIKNGRVGYFEKESGAYVVIHTGYRIEVLDSGDVQKDEVVQKFVAEEREFFERNEQKEAMRPAFEKFFEEKGWRVRISETDFEENLEKYLGQLDAIWWVAYKTTGQFNETAFFEHLESAFDSLEKTMLGNLSKMSISIDLERLPTLLQTNDLSFLHENSYASAEDIRKEFEKRGITSRLTPDGFLLPEAVQLRGTVGQSYWANLLGDRPELIEQRLTKVEFLGRKFNVNRYVAPYLVEAGNRLRDAGVTYSVTHGGGYNFRRTWGRPAEEHTTVSELSLHSWGVAIDINPNENVPHENGTTNVPPEMVRIMRDCGFKWGGNWKGEQYDPMHFQFAENPFEYTHILKNTESQKLAAQFGLSLETRAA